nr:lipoprotein 17-related variable surface protein [Mycoplasma phocoeninasale]
MKSLSPGSIASVISLPLIAASCGGTKKEDPKPNNPSQKDVQDSLNNVTVTVVDKNKLASAVKVADVTVNGKANGFTYVIESIIPNDTAGELAVKVKSSKGDISATKDLKIEGFTKKITPAPEDEEQKLRREVSFTYNGTITESSTPQNFKDNIRLSGNSTFVIDPGGTIIVKIKTEASSVPPTVKKYALIKLTLKKESKSLDFYVKFALNTANVMGIKTDKEEFDLIKNQEQQLMPEPIPNPTPDDGNSNAKIIAKSEIEKLNKLFSKLELKNPNSEKMFKVELKKIEDSKKSQFENYLKNVSELKKNISSSDYENKLASLLNMQNINNEKYSDEKQNLINKFFNIKNTEIITNEDIVKLNNSNTLENTQKIILEISSKFSKEIDKELISLLNDSKKIIDFANEINDNKISDDMISKSIEALKILYKQMNFGFGSYSNYSDLVKSKIKDLLNDENKKREFIKNTQKQLKIREDIYKRVIVLLNNNEKLSFTNPLESILELKWILEFSKLPVAGYVILRNQNLIEKIKIFLLQQTNSNDLNTQKIAKEINDFVKKSSILLKELKLEQTKQKLLSYGFNKNSDIDSWISKIEQNQFNKFLNFAKEIKIEIQKPEQNKLKIINLIKSFLNLEIKSIDII